MKLGLSWAWWRALFGWLLKTQKILIHFLDRANLGMRVVFLVTLRNRVLHLAMATNVGKVSRVFGHSATRRNTVGLLSIVVGSVLGPGFLAILDLVKLLEKRVELTETSLSFNHLLKSVDFTLHQLGILVRLSKTFFKG